MKAESPGELYTLSSALIVPVSSDIERKKALFMQNEILKKTAGQDILRVVFDFSAVFALNRATYNVLNETARMVNLMGKRPVFCGFQPGLAAALVELCTDIDSVAVVSSLEEAVHERILCK